MSNYIQASGLYKIAFSPQLASNFSELTVNFFDIRFKSGNAIPVVPSILSRLQSLVAHLTVSEVHFCDPIFFLSLIHI